MTPDQVVAAVSAALADLAPGAPAVVAMSGGPDSAALAVAVRRARPDLDLRGAHVRHGLREDDGQDAQIARVQAEGLAIPFAVHEVQVVDTAGAGIAAAARTARFEALAAAADGGAWLLVAHTADDQAETVLLNLGRGTGTRGLGGMRERSSWGTVPVARPLLAVRRDDARALAAGLPTANDPSNTDPARRRTRVRTELLPALARVSGGPGDPVGVLCRTAALARADADALDELAVAHAAQALHHWGPGCAVRERALEALPQALASRVLRRLLAAVAGPDTELPHAMLDTVRALEGGQADIGDGIRVSRSNGWIAAAPAGAGLAPRPVGTALGATAAVTIPELGLRLVAGGDPGPVPPGGDPAHGVSPPLPADAALQVRGWQAGDRFAHTGAKVADALGRQGIPRVLRPLVPVVADNDGTCWWVAGAGGSAARVAPLLHVALSQ